MSDWWLVWMGLFLVVSGLELWAILNARKGDTLSEQVKPFLRHWVAIRIFTFVVWVGFIVWLTWHWWIEPLAGAS